MKAHSKNNFWAFEETEITRYTSCLLGVFSLSTQNSSRTTPFLDCVPTKETLAHDW